MDFMISLNVVMPLCIYIALGFLCRKLGFLDRDLCARLNRMIFNILFPVTMFNNVLAAKGSLGGDTARFVIAMLAVHGVYFLLLYTFVPCLAGDRQRASSMIQGCFRGNAVLFGMEVVNSLCGEEGKGIASVAIAILVPVLNVLAVILFGTMNGERLNPAELVLSIVKNPIILGTVAGALFSFAGLTLPSFISAPISVLSSMTTPLALMLLGATLEFSSIKKDLRDIAIVSFIKLIVFPALLMALFRVFGFGDKQHMAAVFAIACVPVAVAGTTMAYEMGGDGDFSGELLAVTTVLSMFTVFGWVCVLQMANII